MKRATVKQERNEEGVDKKLEKKLKNFIKNHNPQVIKNRSEYSNQDSVIERRQALNRGRRKCATTSMNLFRNLKLKDESGNSYYIIHNKPIREKTDGNSEIIQCDKKGNIESYKLEKGWTEMDLLNINLDVIFPSTDNKEELVEYVSRLLDGDEKIENIIKRKKKIVDAELDEADCYWKNFSEEEKQKFLDQIKP